jgi:GxxExxY protein
MDPSESLNELTHRIIGLLIRVHRVLGPGLLESIYRRCVAYELRQAGYKVDEERPVPLVYGDMQFVCAYRIDMIVNDQVVIEIKSVERLEQVHGSQLLTYLRLTNCPIGLLVNFNTSMLKNGLKRFINSPAGCSGPEPAFSAADSCLSAPKKGVSARPRRL